MIFIYYYYDPFIPILVPYMFEVILLASMLQTVLLVSILEILKQVVLIEFLNFPSFFYFNYYYSKFVIKFINYAYIFFIFLLCFCPKTS
jgi:hypothetical protein